MGMNECSSLDRVHFLSHHNLTTRSLNFDYLSLSLVVQLSTHALTLFRKDVKLGDGTTVKADFWDTAGQERFSNLHASYYYQADACILVFDVTRKQTYVNLKKWYKDLREHCEGIPCILVANK